jgi:hypothetical protein
MAKKNKTVKVNNTKQANEASKYLMMGAGAAVVLSAIGYLGYDFWLASTQWLLVAAVLALFGVYMKLK